MYLAAFDAPSALTKNERAQWIALSNKRDDGQARGIRRPLTRAEFADLMSLTRRMRSN